MPLPSKLLGADKSLDAAYLALSTLRDAHKPSDKTISVIGRFSDNNLREFREELGNLDQIPPNKLMSLAATDKSWAQNFVDDHPFLQRLFKIVCINFFSPSKLKHFALICCERESTLRWLPLVATFYLGIFPWGLGRFLTLQLEKFREWDSWNKVLLRRHVQIWHGNAGAAPHHAWLLSLTPRPCLLVIVCQRYAYQTSHCCWFCCVCVAPYCGFDKSSILGDLYCDGWVSNEW